LQFSQRGGEREDTVTCKGGGKKDKRIVPTIIKWKRKRKKGKNYLKKKGKISS